jgi:hypothetical protein
VITQLEFYKPDEERVKKAYLDYELTTQMSPLYGRMKELEKAVERKNAGEI